MVWIKYKDLMTNECMYTQTVKAHQIGKFGKNEKQKSNPTVVCRSGRLFDSHSHMSNHVSLDQVVALFMNPIFFLGAN